MPLDSLALGRLPGAVIHHTGILLEFGLQTLSILRRSPIVMLATLSIFPTHLQLDVVPCVGYIL